MWIYHGNGIAQAQLLWLWKQISPKCHHTRQRGGRSPARSSRPPHVLPGNFGIGRSGRCCGQTWLFILSLPPCFNFLSCSPLALRTSEQASFLKQRPPGPTVLKRAAGTHTKRPYGLFTEVCRGSSRNTSHRRLAGSLLRVGGISWASYCLPLPFTPKHPSQKELFGIRFFKLRAETR